MDENMALNSTSICFLTHRARVSMEKRLPTGTFSSHIREESGGGSRLPHQGGDLLPSHFQVVVSLML